MFPKIRDRNVWLINATIFFVGVACGIALSLLALHLDDRGYSKTSIGTLAAWFALGIVGFSFPMTAVMRRLSPKKVLVGSLLLYAVTVAVFPFVTPWFALAAFVRVLDGAASAGMWIGCETILLSRADGDEKASITAVYAISIAVGYMLGPFCSKMIVALLSLEVAFIVAGAISLLTGLMVWARLDEEPLVSEGADGPEGASAAMSLGGVLRRIKTSCFGNFAYGYFQASVVLFLPLYLVAQKGITREQTILIPGFFALGMLSFVSVAGKLADRVGHLFTMRILACVGMAAVLSFVLFDRYWLMCAAVTVAGATIASISPISLALQGVILPRADYGRGNALYNGFYAAGMLLGPPISGGLFTSFGGPAMLYHLAGLWSAFVVYSLIYASDDPARAVHRARRTALETA
ncbi:MAG: MFS transporter [Myxococcales bacterium]|nr:MFS transporter [Myxococcales bacterium]